MWVALITVKLGFTDHSKILRQVVKQSLSRYLFLGLQKAQINLLSVNRVIEQLSSVSDCSFNKATINLTSKQ